MLALTWHAITPSRGECSSTPIRERTPLNLRGRDRTLVHRARPATEQLKARAAESSVGFPSIVLASDACDFMVLPRGDRNRHDVLFGFLSAAVRIRFAPEFEHTFRQASQLNEHSMAHSPTRCDHRNESARGFLNSTVWRRSYLNGLRSLLSYLFGWLGHCTQLSPPSARNRCASLDVSLFIQDRSRRALCLRSLGT